MHDMNNFSYFLVGMATQAFIVAGLQKLNFAKVTPVQQGLAGAIFIIIAAIVSGL